MPSATDKRVFDNNGHMHVADCTITRGIISDYLSSEVAGAAQRGFGPTQKIRLYRDPAELSKGLDSFRDIPLLRRHIMVSAEEPQKDDIVGVISNPRMADSTLVGDVTFWSLYDGIEPVMTKVQEDLSCGYSYELDWTPGEIGGLRYDARMVNIRGNHCAIVPKGRVPGARVADQQPTEFVMSESLKFPRFLAALQAALGLKNEQVSALDTALDAEMKEAVKAKKARAKKDDDEDEDDLEAEDKAKKVKEAADAAAAAEAARVAQDAAIAAAVEKAVAATHALYAARDAVSSKVGVTALDSAEATYRFALEKSGVDHKQVAADALPALWDSTNKGVDPFAGRANAKDAAALDMSKLFPGLSLIRKG